MNSPGGGHIYYYCNSKTMGICFKIIIKVYEYLHYLEMNTIYFPLSNQR